MPINRAVLFALSLCMITSTIPTVAQAEEPFVRVEGRHFMVGDRPMYVCGTNLWYGAHLGRPSNLVGRARLVRELDRLQALGVNNLRVLGAAEATDVPRALSPATQTDPGEYNEDLLQGLDYLAVESGKRGMRLVVFLNNYWDWSGGMAQYLAWADGTSPVCLSRTPWPEYNRVLSGYYTNTAAQELNRRYIAMLLSRKNSITGRAYRDDPTIMAWELANEPRPGERAGEDEAVFAAFLAWVDATSAFIHELAPRQLVTTGSEGNQGCGYTDERFRLVHALKGIDYAVFHLWPKNWRWFELHRHAETIDTAIEKSRDYVRRHFAEAAKLEKPVVCEEFGLDRDGGLGIEVPTSARDRLYAEVFALIEQSIAEGGPAAGSNFWLWGGEGRPPWLGDAPDGIGVGDMLQEEAGRNTVLDCDTSTLGLLRGHFGRLAKPEALSGVGGRSGAAAPAAIQTCPKTAYLTIDDGPTLSMMRKTDFLRTHGIPAVLFCTGQALERFPDYAITAIRQGFLIGNHSYDHPFFSDLPVPECLAQIRRTDAIIEALYARAGVVRPAKFFRFPYGDKGALTRTNVYERPSTEGAARKAAIQAALRELGYRLPQFPGVTYGYWRNTLAADVDWYWTYDVMEWSVFATEPMAEVTSLAAVFARMEESVPEGGRGLNTAGSEEIILTHDHPETDGLFEPIIGRLLAKGVKFAAVE